VRNISSDSGSRPKKLQKIRTYLFLVPINFEYIEGRVEFCGIDGARVNTHNTFINPTIQHNDDKDKENEESVLHVWLL
jgi:hypothetical protein